MISIRIWGVCTFRSKTDPEGYPLYDQLLYYGERRRRGRSLMKSEEKRSATVTAWHVAGRRNGKCACSIYENQERCKSLDVLKSWPQSRFVCTWWRSSKASSTPPFKKQPSNMTRPEYQKCVSNCCAVLMFPLHPAGRHT
jgi:hypothetical protein